MELSAPEEIIYVFCITNLTLVSIYLQFLNAIHVLMFSTEKIPHKSQMSDFRVKTMFDSS